MITLSPKKVLSLHAYMAQETGGCAGVRDFSLLQSALKSPFATFDGIDLYQSIEEKAAFLGFSLIRNHAFIDGNKRIGAFVMLIFLDINGISITADNPSLTRIILDCAAGKADQNDLLDWILSHKS